MSRQPGYWSVEERLCEVSAQGDPLKKLLEIADFELVQPVPDEAPGARERLRGGRLACDAVPRLKMLCLQAQHGLSFETTGHAVRDRLSWMRFCGVWIANPGRARQDWRSIAKTYGPPRLQAGS